MNGLIKLIKGEFKRLVRYKIVPVSLVTAIIWIVLFIFVSGNEAQRITPLLIFVDVAVMSILLLGASYHLEKQEGTIRTMMVMPVTLRQILVSKTVAAMILAFESVVITSVALYFVHGITFNYFALIAFVAIGGFAHVAIGFILSLFSRDFTSMLGLLVLYMFVFTIPSILFSFGVIDANYEWLFMISPSHSANHLISSAVSGEYKYAMTIGGCIYLALLSAGLFKFVVCPGFKDKAARG